MHRSPRQCSTLRPVRGTPPAVDGLHREREAVDVEVPNGENQAWGALLLLWGFPTRRTMGGISATIKVRNVITQGPVIEVPAKVDTASPGSRWE